MRVSWINWTTPEKEIVQGHLLGASRYADGDWWALVVPDGSDVPLTINTRLREMRVKVE